MSDVDIVFRTARDFALAADRLAVLNARFQQAAELDCMSPGDRISTLILDELNLEIAEGVGLLNSAKTRSIGLRTTLEGSNCPQIALPELPTRDVQFALPYALLRFFEWHRLGSAGHAAAISGRTSENTRSRSACSLGLGVQVN